MTSKIEKLQEIFTSKEFGVLPGNLAFSFFLSVIPILTLIFYVLTSFNLPLDMINDFLTETFPQGVVDLLQPVFTSELTADSLIPIILGITVAANGCNAIILTSNTIYNFKNASFLRRMIKSLLLTMCIILLIAFVVIVPLLGKSILNIVSGVLNFGVKHEMIINIIYYIIQVPVSLLVMFFFIKIVYTFAPDQRIPSKYVTKGAIFTTISWLLITTLFSFYINNMARYDLVYGNLANIVILLLWFYVLAYVFVIGLYMNKTNTEVGIEKTNTIKLEEIRKKIKDEKKKK